MNRKFAISVISSTLVLFSALSLPVWPDTVKLKNKGMLKGVIKNEDETSLTIAIGTGTMKISKDEIESIERASDKENAAIESNARKKAIERGSLVPSGLEDVARRLKEVSAERKTVDNAKKQLDGFKSDISKKNIKFKSLRADFEERNREIHDMDPDSDVERYNKLITEMNMTNTEISRAVEDLNAMSPKLPEYERAHWKAITDYGNDVGDFRIFFEKKLEEAKERGITEEESLYFEGVKKAVSELEKGLSKDTVAVTKTAQGMTVKATLNGEVTCTLAVDTGATIVVISKAIADRLEINPNETMEGVEFTLADGSVTKSRVIKIKSVKVGNSVARDVAAAVTENQPGSGVDGLLGMSFLNNFNIKMDVANEKLVLETIK